MGLQLSPDGRQWWNGARWLAVSADGRWRWDGRRWLPLRENADPASGPSVEILICFDTTGSMSDKIESLVGQTTTFVLEAATRKLDLRWSLVAFGDLRVAGDRIVRYPFIEDTDAFSRALRKMPRFFGGSNSSETSLDALSVAALHDGWSPTAVRMCILLTDEPPAGLEVDLETVGRQLRERRIVAFCVAPDHRAYRWLAEVTGGEWWDIFDPVPFDRVLERLAKRMMRLAQHLHPQLASGTRPRRAPD
jgi:hypothetical protein